MDHRLLDDGDLGAVVRAGFSTLKPSPAPLAYPSPSAPVTLSPSSPVPASNLSSTSAISSCSSSSSPAFPCFQTPSFGLPALCDLVTPPSFSPNHAFSNSLTRSLALFDSLPSPPSLQLPSNRRFDLAASAPSVFSSPTGHVPSVNQPELGMPSSFGGRLLSQAQPSMADRVFSTQSTLFSQGFLNPVVSEDPRLSKTEPSANMLSDIAALRRDVGVVPVGLRQPTGGAGALDHFKDLVDAEPSSSATNVPYKARGAKKSRKALQKRVVYVPAASVVSSRPGAGENVPSDL